MDSSVTPLRAADGVEPPIASARDAAAGLLLLLGLTLPWTADHLSGSRHLEVLLTTVLALGALLLAYSQRRGALAGWRINPRLTRLIGATPLVIVALVHLLFDAIYSGEHLLSVARAERWGVGIGLGLSLAGALLVLAPTAVMAWKHVTFVLGVIVAVLAVIAVVRGVGGDVLGGWELVSHIVTSLAAIAFLWLTVWRFDTHRDSAGLLLVATGFIMALGAPFFGSGSNHWNEAPSLGAWLGFTLWPALAASAWPRLSALLSRCGDKSTLYLSTASTGLGLLGAVGALTAFDVLAANFAGEVPNFLVQLLVGLIVAVGGLYGWWSLRQHPASGQRMAVLLAGICFIAAIVLAAVLAHGTTFVSPLTWLLIALPLLVIGLLTVPDSVERVRDTADAVDAATLHSQPLAVLADPAVAPEDADEALPPTETELPPVVTSADTQLVSPPTAGPRVETPLTDAANRGAAAGTNGDTWTAEQASNPKTSGKDLQAIVAEAPHLRPLVAANPATYQALLDWLGTLGDPEVDKALRHR
ncbi:MAG: hypothetical protein FWG11_03060 [Promicromonosporaceae bacterium]|nr:hypothetical protein [Promicromonosporaceae bacterium]